MIWEKGVTETMKAKQRGQNEMWSVFESIDHYFGQSKTVLMVDKDFSPKESLDETGILSSPEKNLLSAIGEGATVSPRSKLTIS